MSITTNLLAALQADQAVSNAFTTIEHSLLTELTVFEIKKEKLPSLILFPGEEPTEPNEHDGFVAQYMTRHIHCLIVATITDIDARKDDIRAVALGWQHDAQHDLTELLSAAPQKQVANYLYWLDTYITRTQIRQS